MKYLITGRNGQLARAFIRALEKNAIECIAPDESRLDITNATLVSDVVAGCKPDVIINCAAYNLVDKAEQDRDAVYAVNAIGPRNLARAAAEQKSILVHFGSDYVFDGLKENGLYIENDTTDPLNEYGKSKLAGEEYVLNGHDRSLVLRLSWVFGEGTQNFIHKLTEWSKNNEYLKIACDEFSVPTSTETVAAMTLRALEQGVTGRYHLTSSGFCSRYEWARLVLEVLGVNKFIRPVSMDVFNLPAPRPKFSAMSNQAFSDILNVDIPAWQDAVRTFLRKG